MRQQLITWLIEDIAPEIRRNNEPESTILKFANEKNLEPALVQALGQLYNTAKTLAFMEKSANRGATFPLLDVDGMIVKYLDVRPKQASKNLNVKSESAYDQFGCDGPGLPDFFKDIPGLKVELETTYEEHQQKSASSKLREQLAIEDDYRLTCDQLDQAKAEFQEDARELLQKMAHAIRRDQIDFEKFEQDAILLYGPAIKSATDLLAHHCQSRHVKVARVTGPVANRLVMDSPLLKDLGVVNDCLFKIAASDTMQEEATKDYTAAQSENQPPPRVSKHEKGMDEVSSGPLPFRKPKPPEPPEKPKSKGNASTRPAPDAKERGGNGIGDFIGGVSKLHSGFGDWLGTGKNTDQQHVDSELTNAKHLAMLQNLLTTDEVLADADPERVVSLFETFRRSSPSLATDPNVVRVALRSMIQHDGVSPFDVKGLLDTEAASQKTDFNRRVLEDADYGGNGFKAQQPTKVQ